MLIKQRKAKLSKRGIYLQDRELLQTVFKPGAHYTYKIDPTSKSILIQPTSGSQNKVSKRKYKDTYKSVIDIRKKEALEVFRGVDYLEVEIFKDHITIAGYRNNEPLTDHQSSQKLAEVSFSRVQIRSLIQEHSLKDTYGRSLKTIRPPLDEVITAVSLFSGAGVFDLGFLDDFKIILALEKDSDAVKTYRYNIGDHVQETDIVYTEKSLLPKADVIIGGSPCQGFSNANRHTHFLHNPNNLLVRQFIDSVNSNENCKVFVLENVPQLLTAGNGQFKNEIEEALSDFDITSGILNASHFGTAQNRKRAFMIGSKIGKIKLPKPREGLVNTVKQALCGLHDDIPNQRDYSQSTDTTIKRFKHVPPGGNIFDIPEDIRPKGGHSIYYRRLEWNEVAPSIVNPRKANILHPSLNRILSVRECARLFDVPDTFTFKGTLSSMQQQICNSVPVSLAKAIAKKVKNAFVAASRYSVATSN
ncbi:DNA cytosine methyltransferase [Bacillus piscicola]|uniref:DNA cytosine methyltransferase n=1 Tax=Bacillus piscicola TaxID=1632684 RepID=UPI001F08ED35|nr:DNA cytosine methyltransferase [Bacillus piscicola]